MTLCSHYLRIWSKQIGNVDRMWTCYHFIGLAVRPSFTHDIRMEVQGKEKEGLAKLAATMFALMLYYPEEV